MHLLFFFVVQNGTSFCVAGSPLLIRIPEGYANHPVEKCGARAGPTQAGKEGSKRKKIEKMNINA